MRESGGTDMHESTMETRLVLDSCLVLTMDRLKGVKISCCG